jgi:RNA polymerase sigma factor (sigma-70 family)
VPTAAPFDFGSCLEAARRRDPRAWELIWNWIAPAVGGYLRVQGAREPDDLASEAFIGVLRNLDSFHGDETAFRSWVFVIAHRRLQDERRRERRKPTPDELRADAPLGGGDAETEAMARLAAARVEQLCARLGPDQRDVLLLRLVADLTVEQVAAVLGKSEGAVKQLQRRGLEAIRKICESEGVPL